MPRRQADGASLAPPAPGRAFGVDLEASFPVPGLPPRVGPADQRRSARLALAPRAAIIDSLPDDAECLWEQRFPNGRVAIRFTAHPEAGYLLRAATYGVFHIDALAAHVRCAPARGSRDHWQRYLIGQVLPFLAVLHELEVFHASVVQLGDRAVVLTGASRAGKSSIAAALLLDGAGFVADDVLAIDGGAGATDDRALAEPGFGLASIRHEVVELVGAEAIASLGQRTGGDDEAIRVAVDVVAAPLPIAAVYFLGRARDPAPLLSAVEPVDPRLLLASSYNFVIRTPDRMIRHLDVCARLARTASLQRVTITPGVTPGAVAAAIADHAAALS